MSETELDDSRIGKLDDFEPANGDFTLYRMRQSRRSESNRALEFAMDQANAQKHRLVVAFVVTGDYPDANLRHFYFLLEGLLEVTHQRQRRKACFCLRIGNPVKEVSQLAKNASEVICDCG